MIRRTVERARIGLEPIEDRLLLSTCTVTALTDTASGSGLEGDLRYCLNLSNTSPAPDNRIEFASGLAGTITLSKGELRILQNVEIDGPGADKLTISGGLQSGVFFIPPMLGPITVNIDDMTVTEGIGVDQGFTRMGGGFYNGRGIVTLTGVVFTGNIAKGGNSPNGGAIYNFLGTMTLDSCVISNNSARDGYAGGIRNEQSGTMTLIDTIVSGNKAQYWAGISTNGSMTILRSKIDENIADEFGGGIDASGTVTVIDSTINGNVAPDGGAGIYNVRGHVTVRSSTIADNQGTGVHTSGLTEIIDSTIARNHGNQAGGFYVYGGTLRVMNSTISGNISDNLGGAINIVEFVNPPDPPDALVDLTATTITNNVAKGAGGGGLRVIATPNGSARALLRSCLVAGNRSNGPGDDILGAVISIGYNFIGKSEGNSGWVAKDWVGTAEAPFDPQLGPLADYGGKTWTHALPAGSFAIKKGDPALQGSYDQRGTWRQPYFNPDPGAFQSSEPLKFQLVTPAQVQKGEPFVVAFTALDADGNHATIYKGTLTFTSTDPAAQLPANHTFTSADLGSHEFTVTLNTSGDQNITATELDGFPFGTASVTVVDGGGRWSELGTALDSDGVNVPVTQRRLRRR